LIVSIISAQAIPLGDFFRSACLKTTEAFNRILFPVFPEPLPADALRPRQQRSNNSYFVGSRSHRHGDVGGVTGGASGGEGFPLPLFF